MDKRKYKYGDLEVMINATLTPTQVRDNWAAIYPELLHANIEFKEDGSVEFTERAATKGAMDVKQIFDHLPSWAPGLDREQETVLRRLMSVTDARRFQFQIEIRHIQEQLLKSYEHVCLQAEMKKAIWHLRPTTSEIDFI